MELNELVTFEDYWEKIGGGLGAKKNAARAAWIISQRQTQKQFGDIQHNYLYLKKLLDDLGDFLQDIEINFDKFEWTDENPKEVWKEWQSRYSQRPKTMGGKIGFDTEPTNRA